MPDPEIDNGDFLWFTVGHIGDVLYEDSTGVQRVVRQTRYFMVDSKAQRKMNEENRTLAFVFRNDAGSAAVNVAFGIRTLLKR